MPKRINVKIKVTIIRSLKSGTFVSGGLGEHRELPQGVRGGALAAIDIFRIYG